MADKTKEIIAGMLKENTGRAMLDSGDAYGRHWERNQSRDFKKEPRGHLNFYSGTTSGGEHYGGVNASMNLYHWLNDRVTYSEALDTLFHEVYASLHPDDTTWGRLIEGFGDFLAFRGQWKDRQQEVLDLMLSKPEWRELWGEEDEREWVVDEDGENGRYVYDWKVSLPMGREPKEWSSQYTYNVENYLDQDIVTIMFDWDMQWYVILQVHGGCDARGGFTVPRLFETGYYGLADVSSCHIYCANGHVWDTSYDSYHFRPAEVDHMPEAARPLDEYEILDQDDYDQRLKEKAEAYQEEYHEATNYLAQMEAGQQGFAGLEMPEAPNFEPELEGVIRHDQDGQGYCPICGAVLALDFFEE